MILLNVKSLKTTLITPNHRSIRSTIRKPVIHPFNEFRVNFPSVPVEYPCYCTHSDFHPEIIILLVNYELLSYMSLFINNLFN